MGLMGTLKKRRKRRQAQAEKLAQRKQELRELKEGIYEQEHMKVLTKKWRGEGRTEAERELQGKGGKVREAVKGITKGKQKAPLIIGLFKKQRRKR